MQIPAPTPLQWSTASQHFFITWCPHGGGAFSVLSPDAHALKCSLWAWCNGHWNHPCSPWRRGATHHLKLIWNHVLKSREILEWGLTGISFTISLPLWVWNDVQMHQRVEVVHTGSSVHSWNSGHLICILKVWWNIFQCVLKPSFVFAALNSLPSPDEHFLFLGWHCCLIVSFVVGFFSRVQNKNFACKLGCLNGTHFFFFLRDDKWFVQSQSSSCVNKGEVQRHSLLLSTLLLPPWECQWNQSCLDLRTCPCRMN